jgi:hypothetical protein
MGAAFLSASPPATGMAEAALANAPTPAATKAAANFRVKLDMFVSPSGLAGSDDSHRVCTMPPAPG